MPSPQISPFELDVQYSTFIRKLGTELRLNDSERAAIHTVKTPNIWAEWGVAVMSGDEVAPIASTDEARQRIPSGVLPLLMGEAIVQGKQVVDFRTGQLAQKVNEMYASQNPIMRQRFERLSTIVADWTFTIGTAMGIKSREWQGLVPLVPQTYVTPDKTVGGLAIKFPGDTETVIPVDNSLQTIINVGPGLTGATFVTALSGYTKEVHLISGGKSAHFVNRWIDRMLQSTRDNVAGARSLYSPGARLRSGMAIKDYKVPEASRYTDGIAPAMGRLATRTLVDMVVMSSVHSAGAEQCTRGVTISQRVLRPGGLLVVKAPDVSLGGEGGLDVVGPHAQELFGKPIATGPCGLLHQYTDPQLSHNRPASFAVYRQPT